MLAVRVYPTSIADQKAKIEVTLPGTQNVETKDVAVRTLVSFLGPRPVGHTFVKDVNLAGGFISKQFSDLQVPGRGGGLSLQRSYTSLSTDTSPLGTGWSHSYRSYVVANPRAYGWASDVQGQSEGSGYRYAVVGGDGTGQVFTCASGVGSCIPQRGFHGALTLTPAVDGNGLTVVYTAKSGTQYEYGPLNTNVWPYRYPLKSIVTPTGQRFELEYHGAEFDYEVARVWEPGHLRSLRFDYTPTSALTSTTAGVKHAQLSEVRLEDPDGATLACLSFGYDDATQSLTRAARHDGGCSGTVVRTESYGYVATDVEARNKKLSSYTDPNGVTTTYGYYQASDALPGETQFLVAGDKRERVKTVTEPAPGGTWTFVYSLLGEKRVVAGEELETYTTTVQSPRSNVPPTVYRLNRYGSTVRVERYVAPGELAVADTLWDAVHKRPLTEVDPRGRTTTYAYDERGNMILRRVAGTALPARYGARATQALQGPDGTPAGDSVERWAYDPTFGGETCHVDPAGHAVFSTYSAGLLTSTRRTAAASCEDAGTGESITTTFTYCGVNGECASGAVQGDLRDAVDGAGYRTRVTAYDRYGNPIVTQHEIGPSTVVATRSYDDRGRLRTETDTLGHSRTLDYDGLDRLALDQRRNGKGSSPGTRKTFAYWPGGQVHIETDAAGLVRTTTLDGLGHPSVVVEQGPGLPAGGLQSSTTYDEVGNKVAVIDRRGVQTTTTFDWGDRPVEVRVSSDRARDVDRVTVGNGGLIATRGYDVAGNKIFETDIHGHRTDLELDAGYRVVGVVAPETPGPELDGAPVVHRTAATFYLDGTKASETDGNGSRMRWEYDFANRIVAMTDGAGRVERRAYDGDGNLTLLAREAPAQTVHYSRTATYDGLGRPRTVTEIVTGTGAFGMSYVYDDTQHVVTYTDGRGYVTTRRLDDLDRLYEEVVDDASSARPSQGGPAVQARTQHRYDAAGNLAATVDPLGRETTEAHDALGRVTARSLPMGVTESFTYDGEGHVLSTTDRRGFVHRTRYDAVGRPTAEQLDETLSAGGATLTLMSHLYGDTQTGGGLVSVSDTDARGFVTVHWLDGLHREVRLVDPENHATTTAWDAVNRRAVRDRRGYVTRYTYDGANRVTLQEELGLGGAAAYSQSTAYDDEHRRQTHWDRRGLTTITEADGLGRATQVTRGGQVTITVYDANGNVIQVTDPNQHVATAEFDGANRKIAETHGARTSYASRTTFTYDRVGNRLETKSARVTGVAYDVRETYDDLNRPVRSEDALGNVTTRAFDEAGNKVCEKRPLGNSAGAAVGHGQAGGLSVTGLRNAVCQGEYVTSYAYDELSKLVLVTDAKGGVYSFAYDATRNLVAKQDANGGLTIYTYDGLGRRRGEYQHLDQHARLQVYARGPALADEGSPDPVAGRGALTWTSYYDFSGNLTSVVDPKQQQVVVTYGVLDRPVTKSWLGVTTERPALSGETYVYDGNGNLTQVTEQKDTASGTVSEVTIRSYDDLDRLESETRYDGKVVAYGYDAKGNRTSVTDPDGVVTSYTFDPLDRPSLSTWVRQRSPRSLV